MLRCLAIFILSLIFLSTLQSFAKDDLITVSKESEKVPLVSGESIINSKCLP